MALRVHGPATTGDLAERLDLSDAALTQIRPAQQFDGMVASRAEGRGERRRHREAA